MAALFKRKDQTTIAELEEYYSNQKSRRTGRAWLMAILSLLITIAVIVALFFGVRWLYRTLTNDEVTVVTTASNEGREPAFGDIRTEEDAGEGTDSAQQGVVSDEAAVTDRASDTDNTGAVAGSTTDSNATSRNNSSTSNTSATNDIPNTGAGDVLLVLPVIFAVAGYALSRKRFLSQDN
jgi:hypothetical protein